MTTEVHRRRDRRAAALAERRETRQRSTRATASSSTGRRVAFGGIVLLVLGVAAFLALGDFFGRPESREGVLSVQSSMAGFTPSTITVKAGETVSIEWWTKDAAIHLQGGVHTMVSPDLGLYQELPAESNRTFTWTVPNAPGTYDVWCDSCCGGKGSPQMHGRIVVEPNAA